MAKFWTWLRCHVLQDHDWTCRAEQGIPPDPAKVKANPMGYFWEYAQGYCSRCGKLL